MQLEYMLTYMLMFVVISVCCHSFKRYHKLQSVSIYFNKHFFIFMDLTTRGLMVNAVRNSIDAVQSKEQSKAILFLKPQLL